MRKLKPINFLSALEKSNLVHVPSFHYLRTGKIPSVRSIFRIDIRKLYHAIIKEYALPPDKVITTDTHNPVLKQNRIESAYFELSPTITIALFISRQEVEIFYNDNVASEDLKRLEELILEHVKKVSDNKKINLITTDSSGNMVAREFSVNSSVEDDISGLYNDDFSEFNSLVIERLNNSSSHGLVLLHGNPGTGKSSIIRYWLDKIKKPFIYLPSNMADHISQPSFLNFLTRHSNSVLVIEDAEDVLMQRRSGSRSAVANLLNISDGLLSDCLKIQVIATFNTEITKIDPAFLRQGRIIGRYNFGKLDIDKSNALLQKIGAKNTTKTPMTLAEIFNHSEKDYTLIKDRSEIGFSLNEKQEIYNSPF